jgi:hypothetical protein
MPSVLYKRLVAAEDMNKALEASEKAWEMQQAFSELCRQPHYFRIYSKIGRKKKK